MRVRTLILVRPIVRAQYEAAVLLPGQLARARLGLGFAFSRVDWARFAKQGGPNVSRRFPPHARPGTDLGWTRRLVR